MNEKILNVVKELREKSKKRNFPQTFDLIISLTEFDVKKPENKFIEDVVLPHGRGEEASVVVFSDTIKTEECDVFNATDIESISKNKRKMKKLAAQTDFFLSEPKLMPLIGKVLGQLLAPRGKMPKLIVGNIDALIKNYKKSVRVKIKDSPVIQCLVGNEKMKDEYVVENVEAVLKFLETKLPKGKHNFGRILLKLTMGKPVKIEV